MEKNMTKPKNWNNNRVSIFDRIESENYFLNNKIMLSEPSQTLKRQKYDGKQHGIVICSKKPKHTDCFSNFMVPGKTIWARLSIDLDLSYP